MFIQAHTSEIRNSKLKSKINMNHLCIDIKLDERSRTYPRHFVIFRRVPTDPVKVGPKTKCCHEDFMAL